MANWYVEGVLVQRRTLQVEAETAQDAFDQFEGGAKGDWIEGLQVSEEDRPYFVNLLIESNDDGPFIMVSADPNGPLNPQFDNDRKWMIEAAEGLRRLAERGDGDTGGEAAPGKES